MTQNEPTLTLLAGGDIGPVVPHSDRLADLVAPILEDADFRFGQCERTYSDRGFFPNWRTVPDGKWSRVSPDLAEIYRTSKMDVVSLASNHALDYGYDPMFDTLDLLRGFGIQVIGAGRDGAEARRPAFIEKDGVRVAILAYCSVVRDGWSAADGVPGLSSIRARTFYEPLDFQPGCPPKILTEPVAADVEAAIADIQAAREEADAVMVSMHWGLRHIPKVLADYQEPIARALLGAGADVIVGHHPHNIKAVAQYPEGPCFYSVGNFMTTGGLYHRGKPHARWGIYWHDQWENGEDSVYAFPAQCRPAVLLRLTFSKQGLDRAAMVPVYMNDLAQPEPLAAGDERFKEIVDHLEWVSDQHPHQFTIVGDEIVLGEGAGA